MTTTRWAERQTLPTSVAVRQVKTARLQLLLTVAVLLSLAYGLMLSSAIRKSSTVDEQTHLFRGTAYLLERATQFRDVHPPLGFALQALPLLTEPDLRLPVDSEAWDSGRWELAADSFLWQLNANPHRLLLLARLSSIWLALLLGALAFRWAGQLGGAAAALAALALLLFDPNMLAHGRLMTNDLTVTAYLTAAAYSYWRWTRTGRWAAVVAFGLALGLAGATKYSAITLVPALGLVALWLAWQRRSGRPIVALALGGLIAVGVIWALYGFQLRPVPLAPLWDDLAWTLDYFGRPAGAYLLGETRTGGWWYYFPLAYLVKTPLPTLALVGWAIAASMWAILRRRRPPGMDWSAWLVLVLPPVVYFVVSLIGPLNIGYRHLLPMLPFAAVFVTATLLGNTAAAPAWLRWSAGALVASVVVLSLIVWPDYIPYFNRLAGSPEQRWQVLSDSNIDWGQDLPALAAWNAARDDGLPLYVSYFGTAHPQAYGLAYRPLPTWAPAPEQLSPDRQTYDPADPAPGWYAISTTNLHGHVLAQPNLHAAFRAQPPATTIGDSIRVYHVAPRGPAYDLALAGLTPNELAAELRTALPGNDRRLRWIADGNALIWTADGVWLATAVPFDDALQPFLPPPIVTAGGQTLYHLPTPPAPDWATHEAQFGSSLALDGSQVKRGADGAVDLLTLWTVLAETDRPLKIFVHALDAGGVLISQWDGLSVDPASLQAGDRFMQTHRLPAPAADAERLVVGVYDGETQARLLLPDGSEFVGIGP